MQRYAQIKDPGRDIKATGENAVWLYDVVWDYDMLHGCVCDPGFSGIECSALDCPLGDDPLRVYHKKAKEAVCNEAQLARFLLVPHLARWV